MDTYGSETSCKNAPYGCTFASSSEVDIVKHFQWDCSFHPVRCFKCNKPVRKDNFEEHYMDHCKDNTAVPCPAPEEVPDVGGAEAIRMISGELHFLRECVGECKLGVESLSHAMKDVAADVAEVKVVKTKQEDLEAIVKGQGDVIQELSKSTMFVLEKVDKVRDDMGALFKECVKESKLGVDMLTHVMESVAADVAELKLRAAEQKEVEASVKQQGNLFKELEKSVLMNAENVSKMEEGIGTIVQRAEEVDGVVKEVRLLTRFPADRSEIHWYVENVSHYVEECKRWELSFAESDVFTARGYSARLKLEVMGFDTHTGIFSSIYPPYLNIVFCVCRGPNDSLLQWPFRIPFTLSLVHPKDASKSMKYEVTPSEHLPECFEKPKYAQNTGISTVPLCSVKQAQDEGFIENDAVCLALTLHE